MTKMEVKVAMTGLDEFEANVQRVIDMLDLLIDKAAEARMVVDSVGKLAGASEE